MTKYIIGPDDIIRMHSEKYDKDIYLMGDIHRKEYSCPDLTHAKKLHLYLDDFFKKSDKSITYDFFFETGFYNECKEDCGKSYILELQHYFRKKECFFNIKGNKCHKEYPNVRFQAFDIRNIKLKNKINAPTDFWKLMRMYRYFHNFKEKPQDQIYLKHMEEMKDFILVFSHKKNIMKAYKTLYDIKIIKSQIDNIKDKKLKNKIIKFYDKKWKLLFDNPSVTKFFYEKNKKLGLKIKNGTITKNDFGYYLRDNKQIFKLLLDATSLGPDIYLSLRLFRDFNDKNKSKTESKKIIIYSGRAHTNNYFELLRFVLGFTRVEKSTVYHKSCPDISGMKQPFFS